MPRFFVSSETLQGSHAILEGEQAAHAKVLRLSRGDEVTLCDGEGTDALCRVEELSADTLVYSVRVKCRRKLCCVGVFGLYGVIALRDRVTDKKQLLPMLVRHHKGAVI